MSRALRSSYRRCALAAVPVLLASALVGFSADRPIPPHHLVGHEDAPLLRRVQDLIDDWDPRKLVNPLVAASESVGADGKTVVRRQLRRGDLAEFVADLDAAEALGKAFFWDMQAGSDFRRTPTDKFVGTACATCHYKAGADPRTRYTTRVPYVVWDKAQRDAAHPLAFGDAPQPFDAVQKANEVFNPANNRPSKLWLIVGSQGVEPAVFDGFNGNPSAPPVGGGAWASEKSRPRTIADYSQVGGKPFFPEFSMFVGGQQDAPGPNGAGKRFRQITNRNSPSVANAVFADRLFHDGRAESTFNGFSIFGDADRREVIHRGTVKRQPNGDPVTDASGSPVYGAPVPVRVALTNAALASQAVGPIVNDVEMSYSGRTFPNVAFKLLPATPLKHQPVGATDSALGAWARAGYVGPSATKTYADLIRRAFRREWWDGGTDAAGKPNTVPLVLLDAACPDDAPARGELMHANFSLYWGISVMLYEASLVSNRSPFDAMMQGRPEKVNARWDEVKARLGKVLLDRDPPPGPPHENGAAVFQHGMRVFVREGCTECHSGPLFSEVYKRKPEDAKFPIQYQIDRVLLPNSRADALALNYRAARERVLSRVANELTLKKPEWSARAPELARHLDALREVARGNAVRFGVLIANDLGAGYPRASADDIAQWLIAFERTAHTHFGNRTFFDETERVALADTLTEPVLVEKMPIPQRALFARPPLPIAGPLAREKYAFYDLGFYALGVSPPRYDRGNGARAATDDLTEEAALARVIEDLSKRAAAAPDDARLKALKPYAEKVLQARKDKVPVPDRDPAQDRQVQAEVQRVRVALRPGGGSGTSAPGSANRFNPSWKLPPPPPPAPGTKVNGPGDAPACDPDADEKRNPPADYSWDRTDPQFFPGTAEPVRRADTHFVSRARRLVTTEDRWGYRKPFLSDNELAFWGAFKTPTLRNVELTAPYMHNGRLMTLEDVVAFYARGGDLLPSLELNPDKHPEMKELNMTASDKIALVFFLLCLTDDRVRDAKAPFDRPFIRVPHGYNDKLEELCDDVPASVP